MTPWLFAAAAVAYLAWQGRSAAPAGLPPLVPSTPPLPSAPVAGGVSPLLLGAILIPWGLLAFSHFQKVTPPDAPPEPAPAAGLDLRGKFTGELASTDASVTAELLSALADAIEYDGTHEKRLTTGAQLADLRSAAREYRTQGVSLGQRQPLARDAIKAYLDAEVGTDGGPVDDAGRARWVKAFRAVSAAAKAAIGR